MTGISYATVHDTLDRIDFSLLGNPRQETEQPLNPLQRSAIPEPDITHDQDPQEHEHLHQA